MKISSTATISALASASLAAQCQAPVYALTAIHSGDQRVHLRAIGIDSAGFWTIGGEHGLGVSFNGSTLHSVGIDFPGVVGIVGDGVRVSNDYSTYGFGLQGARGSPNQVISFDGEALFTACPGPDNTFGINVNSTCDGGVGVDLLVFQISE